MGFGEDYPVRWCHRHSQRAEVCGDDQCLIHADDQNYAMPESPVTPVQQASIEFKNIMDTLIGEGFTEPQALYLLAVQMTGNPGIAPGVDLPNPPT